jgi:hypothetical protein
VTGGRVDLYAAIRRDARAGLSNRAPVPVRVGQRVAAALTKARERRRALDAARDEHDPRVEEATAEALVALETRREAEQTLEPATATLAERCVPCWPKTPRPSGRPLLELDTAEVRRLTKTAHRLAATARQSRRAADRCSSQPKPTP